MARKFQLQFCISFATHFGDIPTNLYKYPIASMYAIYFPILPQNKQPNVGNYTSPMDGMGIFHILYRHLITSGLPGRSQR